MSEKELAMHHIYDLASMAYAPTKPLDPALERLLRSRIQRLDPELVAYTEYLLIEPGDTEEDIIRCVGFSPLVEPIDCVRFGEIAFHPFWDWLAYRDGWYEMIVTFGSTFAYHLLVCDVEGTLTELRSMCRTYAVCG